MFAKAARRATRHRNKPVYVGSQQCDVKQRTTQIQLSKNNKEKEREAEKEETKERNDEIRQAKLWENKENME